MQRVPVNEVREQLGLPASAKLIGYVVHFPQAEEVLAGSKVRGGAVIRAYSQDPALAKLFVDYRAAVRVAKTCRQPAEVGLLFDTPDQLFYARSG